MKGTIKLHGTNASIVSTPDNLIYAQSKSQIITIDNDNAGFAKYVNDNKETYTALINKYKDKYSLQDKYVIICGEWIGKGINKGCAIHNIENKHFVVFGIKICSRIGEFIKWEDLNTINLISDHAINCYTITEFPVIN